VFLDAVYFQWRNDGVAAASRDGGPHWQGAPDSSRVLSDYFLMFLFVVIE